MDYTIRRLKQEGTGTDLLRYESKQYESSKVCTACIYL